jgi:hypothetical protein
MPTYAQLEKPLQDFIEQQKIFFVGSAAPEGRVNIALKGNGHSSDHGA